MPIHLARARRRRAGGRPPRPGLRVTPQRQLIYTLLAEKPSHLTVAAVHEAVLAVLPTVSLRTVYQALHDLEAMGEIRLVQVGNGSLRVDTRPGTGSTQI